MIKQLIHSRLPILIIALFFSNFEAIAVENIARGKKVKVFSSLELNRDQIVLRKYKVAALNTNLFKLPQHCRQVKRFTAKRQSLR